MQEIDFVGIKDKQEFKYLAIDTFNFQYRNNSVYREYVDLIGVKPSHIKEIVDIPFLPISYFKTHEIICSGQKAQIVFESSRTTGQTASRHLISDLKLYEISFRKGFEFFYGPAEGFRFLALLPTYLEREGSSLVYMMDNFIRGSLYHDSGFYLDDLDSLVRVLENNEGEHIPTILLGVSYALLDLAKLVTKPFKEIIVIETGGMKGKRKEVPKYILHRDLTKAFGLEVIHSEYGMTELLSQAYSDGGGKFRTPPWMKVMIRDIYDPFRMMPPGRSGGINIIDLANRNSVSFIETQDLGKLGTDGSFEVSGRLEQSDIRGCNLLV